MILMLNFPKTLTGKVTYEFYSSWTKAICNETHCQDYEIHCKGENLIYQKPIENTIVKKTENWTDPRNESWKKRICGN